MKSKKFCALVLLMLTAALAPSAFAQSDRGAITGTVKDPNGAFVAEAKVTVINAENGEVREATTSGEGTFTIPQLVAAPYQLTVEAPGFKTATVDDVRVGVQITRTVEVTLEIGQVGESVTVSSEAAVIQTDTPVQQLNVTEKQVRELPLLVAAESGGRSPLSFIFLDSSVVSQNTGTGVGQTSGSTGTNATNFRIAGGQGLGADILIDGAQTRRGENGSFFSEVAPGPNAFQEFTISTSQYSSEFGNSTGGVINFTIKSGGNDFHGEAYLFHINDALNSNIDRNRLTGTDKPLDRQFDYGFSVGGPVWIPRVYSGRNRTFFFFNYGGYRTFQSESVDLTVPTLKMRQGDFSELLTDPYILSFRTCPTCELVWPNGAQIFDPSQPPGQRTAIPGNRLDLYNGGALISPAGQNIVNLFPEPNQTGPLGSTVFRNYHTTSQTNARTNYYVSKITHTLTDRQLLNFSYTFRELPSIKGGFPRFPEPFVAEGVWDQSFKSYYARLQHDWTLSANLLNHFNAGFSRSDVTNRNFTAGEGTATELGIPAGVTQNFGFPLIGFPGYGDPVTSLDPRAAQGGGSTSFSNRVRDNSVHISDFVTYIRGRHSMKFGGEVRIQQLNNASHFDIGGRFNFRSNQTANTNDFTQGWPIASLLTGRTEFAFNSNQTIDPGLRFFSDAFFFQDDFKVTPRLTLNLGIRYDYGRPREESGGRYRGFDPDTPNPAAGGRLGAIVGAAGQGGLQAEFPGLIEPDRTNFGPRFGFAYSINDQTVVRGGYGIYYSPIIYNDFGNAGYLGYNPGQSPINFGLDAGISLENFPLLPQPNPADQAVGQLDRSDIDYFNKNYKAGRTAQWSLDIQRQLPWNFALQVGYIGNRGTRLRSNFNPVNKLPLEALKLGLPILNKRLVDLTDEERGFAASQGFNLPTDPDDIYPGFNNAGGFAAGTVAQALRPFPQYGIINNRMESEGQSLYHALKIDLQRRFTQGIQFGLSYTKARLTGNAAEDVFGDSPINGVVQNPYDRESLNSLSPSSLPHSLVFNYIIELPFGKGRRFLNQGGLVDRLVGGWQITGIHRYRSGNALVPFIAGGQRDFLQLVGFLGNLRPNFTGEPFTTDNPATGTEYRYLNSAAFSRPDDYRNAPPFLLNGEVNPAYVSYYADPTRFFGNSSPTDNDLRGQPFFSEDFSVMKKTRISETTYFEIRMEVFNLFNRGRFGYPILNVDDQGGFGLSFRNGDIFQPRRIQVGGRFVF
ncbi:MAG TPA: carboxypeptidase regulatory-like domain-containing protein [Pyrinomonadaceae bacterium]|nr:carboxypeptidase regulatory-like domain-containing protein [Pyrinomonadaceae bacterium]